MLSIKCYSEQFWINQLSITRISHESHVCCLISKLKKYFHRKSHTCYVTIYYANVIQEKTRCFHNSHICSPTRTSSVLKRTRVVQAHFWPKDLTKKWELANINYFIFFVLNNVFKRKNQQNLQFNKFYNDHMTHRKCFKCENTKKLINLMQYLILICRY